MNREQEHREELQRLKFDYERELDQFKQHSESTLSDIRYIHEQEKKMLEGRLEKTINELKMAKLDTSANYGDASSKVSKHT